jgi:hypothetical protein
VGGIGEQGQGVGPETADQFGDQGDGSQDYGDYEATGDAVVQMGVVIMIVVV